MIATDDTDHQDAQVQAARPDLHNAEVDEDLAALALCGIKHLAMGDVCLLPQRHPGGCTFTFPSEKTSD